jgi:hypothetical protein
LRGKGYSSKPINRRNHKFSQPSLRANVLECCEAETVNRLTQDFLTFLKMMATRICSLRALQSAVLSPVVAANAIASS